MAPNCLINGLLSISSSLEVRTRNVLTSKVMPSSADPSYFWFWLGKKHWTIGKIWSDHKYKAPHWKLCFHNYTIIQVDNLNLFSQKIENFIDFPGTPVVCICFSSAYCLGIKLWDFSTIMAHILGGPKDKNMDVTVNKQSFSIRERMRRFP